MNYRFVKLIPFLLVLFIITACGQSAEKTGSQGAASEPASETQSIPDLPNPPSQEDWPADLAPAELPEYTAGTVTASAVDSEGVLTIKITDTNKSDLYVYIGKLQSSGWNVTSNDDEAEALLGLYSATFVLQGADKTVLQIDVYTEEAGSWPAEAIPPVVPEPGAGVLVGQVEVLSAVENMWYFDYTYDGIDEAAAEAYMNSLTEKGWSGDAYQMYKAFEWKGKSYEATIEIYETVADRTTFTCNFYLSAAEPAAQTEPTSAAATESTAASAESTEAPLEGTEASTEGTEVSTEGTASPKGADASAKSADTSVVGSWTLGMLSGGQFNAGTGKYEGGASGMGQIYTFKPDGTYTALVVFGDTIWFTGNYSVAGDLLTLTGRTVEESKDGGKTWGAPETLPDASAYFVAGKDDSGTYLLLGQEGEKPPLEDKKNAMKYSRKN